MAGASGLTAIECGVAGGNGLCELSRYAKGLARASGLEIRVAGFDTGTVFHHPRPSRCALALEIGRFDRDDWLPRIGRLQSAFG